MVILSLGSNLSSTFGDRFDNLKFAMSMLNDYGIKIEKKSSFYETPSYPDQSKPKFINIVVNIKTHLEPTDLMSVLLFIENKLKRSRNQKNDPRTCDIDIIDYNGQILDFNYKNLNLTLPHEKLLYRNFVLIPLHEIFPKWKHPKTKDSIEVLINKLSNDDKNSILKVKKS